MSEGEGGGPEREGPVTARPRPEDVADYLEGIAREVRERRRDPEDIFGRRLETPLRAPTAGGERRGDDLTDEELEKVLAERRRAAATPAEFPGDPATRAEAEEQQRQRLERLLGVEGGGTPVLGGFERDVEEIPDEEVRRLIREGRIRIDDPKVSAHYERIPVEMGFGPRPIEWPKSLEGKLYRARKVLNQLEDYEEGSDAPGLGPRYREVEAVVTALLLSPDVEKNKQGRVLRTEEKARIALHTGWMGFKLADHIDQCRDAIKNTVWFVHIAWAMQQDAVIEALQYLEDNAEDNVDGYIRATQVHSGAKDQRQPPEKLDRFHTKAKEYLEGFVKKYQAETERLKDSLPKEQLDERNRQLNNADAAQRIAERIWTFTGRMAIYDKLCLRPDKRWDFIGDAKGGAFQMRRLLKFNEWLFTQYGDHWFPELISNVDLVTPDWFSFNEGHFKRHPSDSGGSFVESKRDGWEPIVGVDYESNKPVMEDRTGRRIESYPMRKSDSRRKPGRVGGLERISNRVNFKAIDWKKVSFLDLAERPFDFWSYRKLQQPEAARRKMLEEGKFLRNPTPETLFELRETLSYLGIDHWAMNKNLLENLLEFMEKSNRRKLGRGNIRFSEKDAIIQQALIQNLIRKQDLPVVEKEMLGWYKTPRRFNALFNILDFLVGVVKKAIEEATKFSI